MASVFWSWVGDYRVVGIDFRSFCGKQEGADSKGGLSYIAVHYSLRRVGEYKQASYYEGQHDILILIYIYYLCLATFLLSRDAHENRRPWIRIHAPLLPYDKTGNSIASSQGPGTIWGRRMHRRRWH
jgi:hypothetical protein